MTLPELNAVLNTVQIVFLGMLLRLEYQLRKEHHGLRNKKEGD